MNREHIGVATSPAPLRPYAVPTNEWERGIRIAKVEHSDEASHDGQDFIVNNFRAASEGESIFNGDCGPRTRRKLARHNQTEGVGRGMGRRRLLGTLNTSSEFSLSTLTSVRERGEGKLQPKR